MKDPYLITISYLINAYKCILFLKVLCVFTYLQQTSKRRRLYENISSGLRLIHELYKNAIDGPILRKRLIIRSNSYTYYIGISNDLGLTNTKSKVSK